MIFTQGQLASRRREDLVSTRPHVRRRRRRRAGPAASIAAEPAKAHFDLSKVTYLLHKDLHT